MQKEGVSLPFFSIHLGKLANYSLDSVKNKQSQGNNQTQHIQCLKNLTETNQASIHGNPMVEPETLTKSSQYESWISRNSNRNSNPLFYNQSRVKSQEKQEITKNLLRILILMWFKPNTIYN